MKRTLYVLRKPVHEIDPALFSPTESQGDVVLLQESGVETFPYAGGTVFSLNDDANTTFTYDELVKKIFEYDYTVVV
jgi:hypothetical protein